MIERGERRPKIEIKDNEGLETRLGRLKVVVDVEKLAERLEGGFPPERRPEELRIFLGKRPLRTVVVEKHAQEWRDKGRSETGINIQSTIADKLALGMEVTGLLPRHKSSFVADERKPIIHINVPLISRKVSSMEELQEVIAKGWQHEEAHFTSSESEIKQAQELGIRGVKIVTGSALVGAGLGILAGANTPPEIVSTARTVLCGISGGIGGGAVGQLISFFEYLRHPFEEKAREAAKSVAPELLEIFKVTKEE